MGAVKDGGENMLQMVAVPVLLSPDAHHVVVHDHAGPHDVGAGFIVVGILHHTASLVHHGQHDAFEHAVGGLDILGRGEVALKGMGDDVGDAAGGLEGRQALGEDRVHDRELRADAVGLRGGLLEGLLVGDDGVGGTLAAGSGDGQHHADGQGGLRGLAGEEVPEVPVIGDAHGDGLGGVDDAAAADGQEEVDLLFAGKLDALIDKSAARVRLDAAELDGAQAFGGDGVLHPVEQTGLLCRLAAVDDHDTAAAELFDIAAGLVFTVTAEDKIRGAVKIKIIHTRFLCSGMKDQYPVLPLAGCP